MRLRDASLEDLRVLTAINNANAQELSYETVAGVRWYLSAAPYFRVAVDDDGALGGMLIGFRRGDDYHSENLAWFEARDEEDFAYVDRVVVSPDHRGRGLGRRFYEDFEGWARQRGIPRLTCEVNTEPLNEGSLAFHERMGWRGLEERLTGYGPRVLMMEKRLT
ncbi:MAG: GNAT family N-acetyltransferase [Gemmatimonadota bacterium]